MSVNKIVLTLIAIVFIMTGAYFCKKTLRAQTASFELADSQLLADKIDRVCAELNKADQEISKKLDQVLANQATILQELQIVKIRATRSN